MARLPYLDRGDLPEDGQAVFDALMAERGRIGNIFRMLAHSPVLLRRFVALGNTLRHETTLDRRYGELAVLTVTRLAGCEYAHAHHTLLARRCGVTDAQIEQLADWEHAPVFSDEERAVIRYAGAMTNDLEVPDETFNLLRDFLSEEEIAELTLTVGFYNMVVRFLLAMGVEVEPETRSALQ